MQDSGWDIKVTSKGQITLPKEVRDIMLVREGDHLQAVMQDDALVLTRKVELDDSEQIREAAEQALLDLGYAGLRATAEYTRGRPIPERRLLRESIGAVPDLTRLVREGREQR